MCVQRTLIKTSRRDRRRSTCCLTEPMTFTGQCGSKCQRLNGGWPRRTAQGRKETGDRLNDGCVIRREDEPARSGNDKSEQQECKQQTHCFDAGFAHQAACRGYVDIVVGRRCTRFIVMNSAVLQMQAHRGFIAVKAQMQMHSANTRQQQRDA